MNTFRMELLKDRAEKIRPDLSKAREITEKAEDAQREMTADEKAAVEPTLKTAREISEGMKKARDDAAMMKPIGLAIKGRFDLRHRVREIGIPKHQGPQSVRSEHRLRDPQLHQDAAGKRADRPGVDRGPHRRSRCQ